MKKFIWMVRRWLFKKLVGKKVDVVFKKQEESDVCSYVWIHFTDKDVLSYWIVEKDININGHPAKSLYMKD